MLTVLFSEPVAKIKSLIDNELQVVAFANIAVPSDILNTIVPEELSELFDTPTYSELIHNLSNVLPDGPVIVGEVVSSVDVSVVSSVVVSASVVNDSVVVKKPKRRG